ncbi:MAG: acyltransferase [Rhodospirillales bacterium]
MNLTARLKQRVKARDTAAARLVYAAAKGALTLDVRPVPCVHAPLHAAFSGARGLLAWTARTFYWKPVFLTRIANRPRRLRYEGSGVPLTGGPLHIEMGDDCRISSRVVMFGRADHTGGAARRKIIIGNNCGIGWQAQIYAGTRVVIGDNVRIAERCVLAGYAGHPLDAAARARGAPDLDTQARDIVLEDDVWLARGVTVNAGVTIGKGAVIAAGGVVTKDITPGVLAGGAPAKVIKVIEPGLHARALGLAV